MLVYHVHGLKNFAVAGLGRYPYYQGDKPNLREYCVPGYVTKKNKENRNRIVLIDLKEISFFIHCSTHATFPCLS